MEVLLLVGRILFGLIFVGSMYGHLSETEATAGYAEMRGVPNSKMMVQISGVLMGLGGLGVIFGVWMDLAALGLVVYVLIAAFMVHHFWTDDDEMAKNMEMANFMKNLSIAGGGLVIFVLAGAGAPMGWELGSRLFDFTL